MFNGHTAFKNGRSRPEGIPSYVTEPQIVLEVGTYGLMILAGATPDAAVVVVARGATPNPIARFAPDRMPRRNQLYRGVPEKSARKGIIARQVKSKEQL